MLAISLMSSFCLASLQSIFWTNVDFSWDFLLGNEQISNTDPVLLNINVGK